MSVRARPLAGRRSVVRARPRAARRAPLRVLGIDIGGSFLKAAVIDGHGRMLTDRLKLRTPKRCSPNIMVRALLRLVKPLPSYNHIAIGFPGVVRNGRVITAPHWGTRIWANFELERTLAQRLRAPARLINDAEMQGLAVIRGKGLELVLTLGTGAGTALFRDGQLMPHLELAQHPIHKSGSYNDYVGNLALKRLGRKRWNRHVAHTIEILHSLLNYDHLFIGGGNAARITFKLPDNASVVSNDAGIEGGAMLWQPGFAPPP
jgi:polyphosphate glucokinase